MLFFTLFLLFCLLFSPLFCCVFILYTITSLYHSIILLLPHSIYFFINPPNILSHIYIHDWYIYKKYRLSIHEKMLFFPSESDSICLTWWSPLKSIFPQMIVWFSSKSIVAVQIMAYICATIASWSRLIDTYADSIKSLLMLKSGECKCQCNMLTPSPSHPFWR